ncbi:MAG: histidine--tRNA ligase, partial [Chitinophagaceae bacterium]
DKIGIDKVKDELTERGLTSEQISVISQYLEISGDNRSRIEQVRALLPGAVEGISELEFLLNFPGNLYTDSLVIDLTLARGLNYYTGIIFEIKAKKVSMGSIGGGGRYDDLTGTFGVKGIPGVGISFGVDRIYDVMEELNVFPGDVQSGATVMFFNLGEQESRTAYGILQQLRSNGISGEIYPESVKMDKQFKYAEKKLIKYAVLIGSKEIEEQIAVIKNLETKDQYKISFSELTSFRFE